MVCARIPIRWKRNILLIFPHLYLWYLEWYVLWHKKTPFFIILYLFHLRPKFFIFDWVATSINFYWSSIFNTCITTLSLQKSERICSNFSKPILNDRSSPPHILVLRNRRIINEWHTFDVNIQIQGMGGSKITISRAPSSSPLCADTHSHFWKKKIPSWWKGKKKLFIIKRNALWIFYTSGTSV